MVIMCGCGDSFDAEQRIEQEEAVAMEFSNIGEKPLVILYGDFLRMRDYCDDLMRFGIEPQMIIADEEATADEKSWWGIPVNTVEALTQYKNEQFLSIVPIADGWKVQKTKSGK